MSGKGHVGVYCAITKCNNHCKNYSGSFFRFPKDIERAHKWAVLCGREDLLKEDVNLYNMRICASHFENSMFKTNLRKRLVPTACPTLCLEGIKCETEDDQETTSSGHKRILEDNQETTSSDDKRRKLDNETDSTVLEEKCHIPEVAESVTMEEPPTPEHTPAHVYKNEDNTGYVHESERDDSQPYFFFKLCLNVHDPFPNLPVPEN